MGRVEESLFHAEKRTVGFLVEKGKKNRGKKKRDALFYILTFSGEDLFRWRKRKIKQGNGEMNRRGKKKRREKNERLEDHYKVPRKLSKWTGGVEHIGVSGRKKTRLIAVGMGGGGG